MESETILLHLALVIVAARVAAELSERFNLPAVVLEILTGVLIGPSVLGLVEPGEVLSFFGEVGAILLLLEVGMQMNLADLAKVGGSALRVAGIGIAVPMVLGFVLLQALGVDQLVALFLGAGITATSVGITARVFGDLRMLASAEARTVLGAAVADDVGGLMILTVVVGIVSTGGIEFVSVASTVGTGLAFVFVAALVCVLAAPRLLKAAAERSRTEGTLTAVGLAIGLFVARIAAAAHLAPIVGSFIAGLGISEGGDAADEVKRRLAPVGHLFIPIFFLLIGINTNLGALADPEILGLAAVLAAVAVIGKLAAGLGVGKGAGDRMLVGISMIPRGEVGLIFASLGLSQGVLDAGNYAVLVIVVLFTTLVPPPWIRHQVTKVRKRAISKKAVVTEPPGGWLVVRPDEVELAAEPSELAAPLIGLEAAILCASRQPGARLVQWLGSVLTEKVNWDDAVRERFYDLLSKGNARSWRFIEVTGLAAALFPKIAEAMIRRRRDPFDLDPAGYLRWGIVEDLNELVAGRDAQVSRIWGELDKRDLVRVAAIVNEAFEGDTLEAAKTREFARSIGLTSSEEDFMTFTVTEDHVLPHAARRLISPTEDSVLELAVQLGSRERAGALYVLAVAGGGMEVWERERLDHLMQLIEEAFSHPDLTGPDSTALIEQRKNQVVDVLSYLRPQEVLHHLEGAPRRYLLKSSANTIARHMKMTETLPTRHEIRLEAEPDGPGTWLVHVAALDRPGLLAAMAKAFMNYQIGVSEAQVSTWNSGLAIDVFRVQAPRTADWEAIRTEISQLLTVAGNGQVAQPVEAVLRIDNKASPWYTVLEVEATDREGLLYRIASALTRAGLKVHSASLSTVGDVAVDTFNLTITEGDGGKLDERAEALLRAAFAGKSVGRWHRAVEGAKARAKK